MLKFTNLGRSYDPVLRRINFTGFDGELEVPFTVDVDVLTSLPAEKYGDKAAYLIAFDADRSSINDVAREIYYNSSKKIYLLTPVDFQ
ncbi:DUF1488 family protein [Stappia sp. GBMRC 2046]|uniref:DUF1488 family protein n=1 Tax=Stappia sediminis TaxID=2692190 RepID=A0A7X3LXY8_9HYPH|nr:DUF1488 family protein [Stappia sediminis]MXN67167.1 DUF1488 family protein [Stappia sediminis]